MKNLIKAIAEEQLYLADRKQNINTSLIDRLAPYGYSTLKEYFTDKQKPIMIAGDEDRYYDYEGKGADSVFNLDE